MSRPSFQLQFISCLALVITLTIGSVRSFASSTAASTKTSNAAENEILGYKAWKNARVEAAKSAQQRLQTDAAIETSVGIPALRGAVGRYDRRLEQARMNIEITQELTVNDYFMLYLKSINSKDALQEAARKLTAEEMGDLMAAYQKQMSTETTEPVPAQSTGNARVF